MTGFGVFVLGLRLGLSTDCGFKEKSIITHAHVVFGHSRQVNTIRERIARKHDSLGDRDRLPTPRPPAATLIFHKGDKREGRCVGPDHHDPVGVPGLHGLIEETLIPSNLER